MTRQLGDPSFTGKRGKTASMRKGRYDGSYTPTEQKTKDRLMKQFMRNPEGGGEGKSAAYRNSEVWCSCGRLNGTHSHDPDTSYDP